MPVEIRELQITAIVQDSPPLIKNTSASSVASANTEIIIAACVEQVMEILKQKNER